MASQVAAAPGAPISAPLNRTEQVIERLVRRRVAVSLLLFAGLIVLDLFVFRSRPRDVLQLRDPLVAVSDALIALGLLIRSWAAGTLRKKKHLATTGPYAWIRNPLYFGSFLMMVGFAILVQDPLTLWIVIGPLAWLYWQAVRSEERQMAEIFPDEWPEYAAAVPRFIPRRFVWPLAGEWSLAQWRHNLEWQAWLGSAGALFGTKLWLNAF